MDLDSSRKSASIQTPATSSTSPFTVFKPSTSSAYQAQPSGLGTSPSPLHPPSLTLNGYPISAPSSSAFPPRKPSRRRMSSHNLRNRKGANSGSGDSATLKPQTGSGSSRPKSSAGLGPSRKGSSRLPNPLLHPVDFVRFLYWRISIWIAGTFSLGMLNEREGLGVMLVFLFLLSITIYSLFFTFPKHIQIVMRRASYYLYGASRDSSGGVIESTLTSALASGSQAASSASSSIHGEYVR